MEKVKNKLNFIYVLKFISSILIAVFLHWNDHLIKNLGYENVSKFRPFKFLTTKTYLLVELFFIISGLLFYIMSSKKIKNNEIKFKDLFIKKLARLLPVIIFSTIFIFICNLILYIFNKDLWSCGTTSLFELFLGLFGGRITLSGISALNGPIWYVSMYLLCIIIAYYLTKKSSKYGDKVFLIPILISLIIFYNFMNIPMFGASLVRSLSSFFIGIFVGKFIILYEDFSLKNKVFTKIISLIMLSIFTICFIFNRVEFFYYPETYSYSLFVFTPLIIFLYGFKHLNKLLSFKLFKFLGDISYSIYIWNFPILIVMHMLYVFKIYKYNVFSYKFFILLFIIHIIIGILSYIFIEKKFKNIKFNFLDKLLNMEVK